MKLIDQLLSISQFTSPREKYLKLLNDKIEQVESKKVALYGTGGHTKILLDSIRFSPGSIVGLIDPEPDKWGHTIWGYKVFSLERIKGEVDIIIISSDVYQEVIYQRIKHLVDKGIDIWKIYPDGAIYPPTERLFFHDDSELGIEAHPYLTPSVLEHINRYMFSRSICYGKTVLDAACGCGYGSALLSENAKQVTGVDIEKSAIDYAKKYFSRSNIQFVCSDILEYSSTTKFDVVVSFETIEHVRDINCYINTVKKLLNEDGLFIVSTPVAPANGVGSTNPWHINEFTEEYFTQFLQEHFTDVQYFVEDIAEGKGLKFREAYREKLLPYKHVLVGLCRH